MQNEEIPHLWCRCAPRSDDTASTIKEDHKMDDEKRHGIDEQVMASTPFFVGGEIPESLMPFLSVPKANALKKINALRKQEVADVLMEALSYAVNLKNLEYTQQMLINKIKKENSALQDANNHIKKSREVENRPLAQQIKEYEKATRAISSVLLHELKARTEGTNALLRGSKDNCSCYTSVCTCAKGKTLPRMERNIIEGLKVLLAKVLG